MSGHPVVMELRAAIDDLLERGEVVAARAAVARLWASAPGSTSAAFIMARHERLRHGPALVPYHVAVLRSFTVEPIVPVLRAIALVPR